MWKHPRDERGRKNIKKGRMRMAGEGKGEERRGERKRERERDESREEE